MSPTLSSFFLAGTLFIKNYVTKEGDGWSSNQIVPITWNVGAPKRVIVDDFQHFHLITCWKTTFFRKNQTTSLLINHSLFQVVMTAPLALDVLLVDWKQFPLVLSLVLVGTNTSPWELIRDVISPDFSLVDLAPPENAPLTLSLDGVEVVLCSPHKVVCHLGAFANPNQKKIASVVTLVHTWLAIQV